MRYKEWLNNFFIKWNCICLSGHGHAIPLNNLEATINNTFEAPIADEGPSQKKAT